MRWLKAFVDEIAGVPPRSLWLWAERSSILTRLIAYIFVILRLLSPLQWWKYIYRKISNANFSGDHNQKRANFHAQHTEMYFIFICALIVSIYFFSEALINHFQFNTRNFELILRIVVILITVESFSWIAYYLFWRNYAEPKFSLYSPTEYLVLFPIVIIIQVFGFSYLDDISPEQTFLSFFDNSGDNPWYFRLLGFFYFVIVIANLRSMAPSTNFKRDNTINIIGCGDAVLNRMLPALLDGPSSIQPTHIKIFSTELDDRKRLKDIKKFKNIEFFCPKGSIDDQQDAIVKECISQNSPVIIATPSDSHYFYLTKLAAAGLPVICEKPLVRFTNEIKNVYGNADLYKENLFALSYYSLEKALPLTYFFQLNSAHLPFLKFTGINELAIGSQQAALANILDELGRIEEIDLYLHEGTERSPEGTTRLWTERPNEHAFETLVHLIILTNKILKSYSISLDDLKLDCVKGSCQEASTSGATTYLRLTNWGSGEISTSDLRSPYVSLACGKYMPEHLKKRGGTLKFLNGIIEVDFDKMSIVVKSHDRPAFTIENRYSKKYWTLASLVNRFLHSGYEGARFDEFNEQIEVLSWMSSYKFEANRGFKYSINFEGVLESFEIKNALSE